MAAPGGNTKSANISYPNPNPNHLDVTALHTQMPANSPDAGDVLSNLFSTLPEEMHVVISEFIIKKIKKMETDLKCRIERIFQDVIAKLPEKSDTTAHISEAFGTMLPGMIDEAISSVLAGRLKEVLSGVLEAKVISVFENACEKLFVDEVNAATATATRKQDQPAPILGIQRMVGLTSSINATLNHALDIIQLCNKTSKEELRKLLSERRFEEVFVSVLQKKDVSLLRWLFLEVDHKIIDTSTLSQKTLLQLYKWLSDDIENDTSRKLLWMTRVVTCIDKANLSINEDAVMTEVDKRLDDCTRDFTSLKDRRSIRKIRGIYF